MTAPAPFAISPDGAYLACADGPELLVYTGNGAPIWKAFCDDILVGVAVTLSEVVTVDGSGQVARWRREDGMQLDGTAVGPGASALVAAGDGTLAVLLPTGPVVIRAGVGPQPIGVADATAIGFGPDSGSLGVGTRSGAFTAVDSITGGAWGMVQVSDAPVVGVAWSSQGHWVISAGDAVHLLQGDASAVLGAIPGPGPGLGTLGVAADGVVAAATCGTDQVLAFDLHARQSAGALHFRREVGQIAFGPGALLGIGLDDGDATLVDLITGSPARTEPHPGRGRNVWRMEDKVEHGILRGALAFQRAGAQPIARYVPRPTPEDPHGGGWMGACLGCVTMLGVTALFCLLIVGIMYVIYAFGLWEAIPIR